MFVISVIVVECCWVYWLVCFGGFDFVLEVNYLVLIICFSFFFRLGLDSFWGLWRLKRLKNWFDAFGSYVIKVLLG